MKDESIDGFQIEIEVGNRFTNKDHYCIDCNNKLIYHEEYPIVNSESPEASQYDFWGPELKLTGNILFAKQVFVCPRCGRRYGANELQYLEKQIRRYGTVKRPYL